MRVRTELSCEEQAVLDNVLKGAAKKMGLQRKQKMPKEIKRMIIARTIGEIKKMRKNEFCGEVFLDTNNRCYDEIQT